MWKSVWLFFALVAAAHGFNTTDVTQCTRNSEFELPLNVYIHGCDVQPCLLPQLQNAVVDVVFRASRNLRNMRTLAQAFLVSDFFPIPYDLGSDAVTCNSIENSYCPLLEGEVVQYQLRMYIESFFPIGLPVSIEFRVEDEDSLPVFCFRTAIRITAANAVASASDHELN